MDATRRNLVLGMGLGCVAGYVDTLGFMALFGLFTAHVTGNFVLIGIRLADPTQASILLKFLAFPAFIAGVAGARVLITVSRRFRRARRCQKTGAQRLVCQVIAARGHTFR
jgi:uncharacterized membrane protein YoaK (UPF0700 family)